LAENNPSILIVPKLNPGPIVGSDRSKRRIESCPNPFGQGFLIKSSVIPFEDFKQILCNVTMYGAAEIDQLAQRAFAGGLGADEAEDGLYDQLAAFDGTEVADDEGLFTDRD